MTPIESSESSDTVERPHKRAKLSESAVTVPNASDADRERKIHNHLNGVTKVDDEVRQKEIEVGIIHYVNPSSFRITGMFKSRYTDFLVNEIDPDGQTLHLTTLKISSPGTKYEEPAAHVTNGNSTPLTTPPTTSNISICEDDTSGSTVPETGSSHNESGPPSDEDIAKLNSHFNDPAVVKEILSLYESIVTKPNSHKPKDHPTVQAPLTTDRTVRAQIHADIRRIFHSRIDSHTDHSGTLVLTAASRSQPATGSRNNSNSNSNNKKMNGRLSWAEKGGEHLHFNLYKENKDSMEMVNLLARLLKTNPKTFRIAGTKDRRGATVQRVSAYRIDASRLIGLNKTLRAAAVGDFQYKTTGLELGQLSGNEFVIALREFGITSDQQHKQQENVQGDVKEEIEKMQSLLAERVASLRENGWINYFGLQRFGSFAMRSDVTGLKILQGDFQGACDSILDYNPLILNNSTDNNEKNTVGTDDRDRAAAISIWRKTNRINDALEKMPKRFSAETSVIRHLGKSPSDHLGALLAIPRNQRTLYVHAYQSRVWNMAASNRWELYGSRVVAGDLVLVHEHRDKQSTISTVTANTTSDTITTDTITTDADGEPIIPVAAHDSWRRADDVFERARPLTSAEAASGAYTIFDVVLPTPGWDVEYPANESGEFYTTFMGKSVDDNNNGGGGGLDPHNMRRKHRDFSLSGSYRKFLARIDPAAGQGRTSDIRLYSRDDEPLLQTDLEVLSSSTSSSTNAGESVQQSSIDEHKNGGADDGSDKNEMKRAAILRFQLGVSQYATMALRELSQGGVREFKPRFSGGR